jgi:hypothetical protein
MAWFHSRFILRPQLDVKSSRTTRTVAYLLHLRGIGLSARIAVRDAVEGEICPQRFLEGRLAGYLARVRHHRRYQRPSFSIASNGERVITWPSERRHVVDFLLQTPENLPPLTGSDSFDAEIHQTRARAGIRLEGLRKHHAALKERRQQNLLELQRQKDAVTSAAERHQTFVVNEATTCNETAAITGLSLRLVVAGSPRSPRSS